MDTVLLLLSVFKIGYQPNKEMAISKADFGGWGGEARREAQVRTTDNSAFSLKRGFQKSYRVY